jgi:hypothetical protein
MSLIKVTKVFIPLALLLFFVKQLRCLTILHCAIFKEQLEIYNTTLIIKNQLVNNPSRLNRV